MALQTYTAGFFTNLSQQMMVSFNQNVDKMLADNGFDTLKVQDLHRLIVRSDEDEDYQKQMEELQKKLAELEKEKEAKKKADLAAQREKAKLEERKRREAAEQERQRQEKERQKQQESYFERRWDDIVDDFEHPSNIPSNMGKDFEDTVDTLEEDEKEVEEFVRKLPDRSRQIWQKLMLLKWIINMWTVGIPWCIVLLIVFFWNIYVNIFWNKFWAEGNFFLLANTFYIVFQGFVSIPLMFEIPPLLRWIKPWRLLSLFSSILYSILFFGSVLDFFYLADIEEKDLLEDQGWGDMFVSLLIIYNLVENFPILIINSGIMLKEAILPFSQMVTNIHAPSHKDKIQLTFFDLKDAAIFFANIGNPAYYGRLLIKWIIGWDPLDMVVENIDDEEHYYAGKVINPVEDYARSKIHV